MNVELRDFFHRFERPWNPNASGWRAQSDVDTRYILRESGLPFLPLDTIEVPHAEMLREALALESAAIPHRYGGEHHHGWKSLVLHGLSSVHTQGAERYGLNPDDESIYGWTDIAKFAPVTTRFFRETFGYRAYQRVRFMYLEPGGFILPHTDADRYFLGPKNIALNNPERCRFVMEGVGLVPFRAGRVIKLALCHRHSVWNDSDETRVHMIVHGSPRDDFWNPHYREAYARMTAGRA